MKNIDEICDGLMKEIKLEEIEKIANDTVSLHEGAEKDFPNQNTVEFVAEFMSHMNLINKQKTGNAGFDSKVKSIFKKIDELGYEMWNIAFDDDSPWAANPKGKKIKVVWDKNKAKKLGI